MLKRRYKHLTIFNLISNVLLIRGITTRIFLKKKKNAENIALYQMIRELKKTTDLSYF